MKLCVGLQILLTVGLSGSASALERGGRYQAFFPLAPTVEAGPIFRFAPLEPRRSFLERATFAGSVGSLEQDATASPQKEGEKNTDRIVAPSFRDFPRALVYNFSKGLFSKENLEPLLIGSAATLAVVPFDDKIGQRVQGSGSNLGDIGDVVGRPLVVGTATGVLILVTPFTDDQRYRAFAFSLGQAWILNNALAEGIKAAVHRTRADGTDNHSFPSGHTSNSFAWATVAAHYYGKKVGVASYIVAALVGLSRIEREAHFASDVVFGATIGIISGLTAVRGSAHFGDRRGWALVPLVGPDRVGIALHFRR